MKLGIFFFLLVCGCGGSNSLLASAASNDNHHQSSVSTQEKKKVVIVGAGPAGLLFAHYLIRRPNYEVHVVEQRSDPREMPPLELKTYPISLLQQRGIRAIEEISPSLMQAVEEAGGWMKGTYFRNGDVDSSSKVFRSPMLTVDRNQLALVLLQHLLLVEPAQNSSIKLHFNAKLKEVELEENAVLISRGGGIFSRSKMITFDCLVGADGAHSAVRQTLTDKGILSSTAKNLHSGRKALRVARTCPDGSFQLEEKCNGWRLATGEVSALAFPLTKDSCQGVLIFPENRYPFENMTHPQQVLDFFEQSAPQSLARLVTPQEAKNLLRRPTTWLYSVRCNPLHVDDKVVLLGDAAHATSTLLGQGANSALQDVQIFFELLHRYQEDWGLALAAWTRERLPCLQAVQEMSEFTIPPTPKMQQEFNRRQKLRNLLPSWLGPLVAGHDTMQLLADTDLSYSQVHRKTRWWSDRVKQVSLKQASAA